MAKKFDFLSPGVEIREIDQSFIPAQSEAEGPIIIGRTRKGPANKPVKVNNLDDFVSVFGLPVAGGNGVQGDMWRDGNMSGPTYASYAAQAWLASENSPVVMVRIAGEQHTDATAGFAGWTLGGAATNDIATNKTAYGLFLIPSSSANNDQEGQLAAVFYATEGAVTLSGSNVGTDGEWIAGLVPSIADNGEFKMIIRDDSDNNLQELAFNFNRSSSKYIRSVFNTNPQLTNADTIEATQRKTYWLGESFTRVAEDLGADDAAAGDVYGIVLPLQSGSAEAGNWAYHSEGAKEAFSGWVFSQQEKGASDLFRFKSLHVGEDIQKDYMIGIENIREPSNPLANPYGTFTVTVKTIGGETVERYTGCNLNPSSQDYIGARIGDQYQVWSDTDRRYRTYGDFQNQSNIIYVELKQFVKDGGAQGHLPAGFFGPVRPKGFDLVSGSSAAKPFGAPLGADFTDAFVQGSGSAAGYAANNSEFASLVANFTGSFKFPSIPLRVSGTDGGAPDPFRAYWGIRPKISTASNTNDADYCDYVRALHKGAVSSAGAPVDTDVYEYSFTFRLDDIVTGSGNTVYHLEGEYDAGNSFTAQSNKTFGDLLDLGVSQFLMPLHGGFEGWDITEKEPLRIANINTGTNLTNYAKYSINKAIDSVMDSEVVPGNLILAPGIYEPSITQRLVTVAETRKDALAIIDLENDYIPSAERLDDATDEESLGDVAEAISSLKGRALNSSYACAFYPWVQIADNLNNGKLVWIPSSVAALGAMARSQAQSELWFAPAGFNRGGLGFLGGSRGPKVLQARQRLDSKERDLLYEVNINPIATFPAEGVVIFGQKTLQASESALDRINVRRLLLYLKSRVSEISRNLLFDQNVQSTWNRFKAEVNPVLSDTRARFGLSDYKLILDETTTTADLVDRNIMYAKIYIKPARAIEYIVVDFVITKTGADFV